MDKYEVLCRFSPKAKLEKCVILLYVILLILALFGIITKYRLSDFEIGPFAIFF